MLPFPGSHVVEDQRTSIEPSDASFFLGERFLCGVSKLSLEPLLQSTAQPPQSSLSEIERAFGFGSFFDNERTPLVGLLSRT